MYKNSNIFKRSVMAAVLCVISQMGLAIELKSQQVAGYYHHALGQFQITALYDGYLQLGTEVFLGQDQNKIKDSLSADFVNFETGIQTSVNAYLVNTGQQLVLIDTGAAQCMDNTLGSIEQSLNAAGYQVDDIDVVLLTHLHPDHACGISSVAGQKSFPKATVYVNQQEFDFWKNPENAKNFPKDKQQLFTGVIQTIAKILQPYQHSQQFKTYKAGEQIVAGIKSVASYGHTAGHSSYLIESGQDKLLILGDVVHNQNLQFAHPEIGFAFDYQPKQAIESRQTQFAQAAKQGYWVAGAHLPFPGLGHIRQIKPQQFEWLPVAYTPVIVPKTTE